MGLTKAKYKQSEIGLIPEDWMVKRFDEFGRFFKGKGIKKDEVSLEGNPCVRYGELYTRYDNVIKETYSFISNVVAEESVKLKSGDILFAGSGETREDIGKSAVILREDTFAGGDIVVFRPRGVDSVFLGFMSNSTPVSKQKAINGQGDAVVHIYSGGISKIKIPLPPTFTEQKAIATALSDADDLIANLDKLITKKKAIKQGVMQQLLSPPHKGGKRLAGFTGEWKGESIKDFAKISTGGGDTQDRNDNGIYPFYVRSNTVERINTYSFDGEAILTSGDGVGVGKIFHYVNEKFDYHQRVYNIHNYRDDILGKYLFYQFSSRFYERVMTMTAKSSVDSVRREMIADMEIPLPPSREEQISIVKVLDAINDELEILGRKRKKYQSIKQGMLQELLTGKTRLV